MKLSELLTTDQLHELTRLIAGTSNPLHGGYLPHLFNAVGGFEFEPSHYIRVAVMAEELSKNAEGAPTLPANYIDFLDHPAAQKPVDWQDYWDQNGLTPDASQERNYPSAEGLANKLVEDRFASDHRIDRVIRQLGQRLPDGAEEIRDRMDAKQARNLDAVRTNRLVDLARAGGNREMAKVLPCSPETREAADLARSGRGRIAPELSDLNVREAAALVSVEVTEQPSDHPAPHDPENAMLPIMEQVADKYRYSNVNWIDWSKDMVGVKLNADSWRMLALVEGQPIKGKNYASGLWSMRNWEAMLEDQNG